jgi:hypothetical protein
MAAVMPMQIPVWPYFFLALLCGIVGGTLLYYNLGSGVPAESSLQIISGNIDRVFLIDDLPGAPTMIIKPLNSIHFTLEKAEGEFRYPGNWPGYSQLWQQLSFHGSVCCSSAQAESQSGTFPWRIRRGAGPSK